MATAVPDVGRLEEGPQGVEQLDGAEVVDLGDGLGRLEGGGQAGTDDEAVERIAGGGLRRRRWPPRRPSGVDRSASTS